MRQKTYIIFNSTQYFWTKLISIVFYGYNNTKNELFNIFPFSVNNISHCTESFTSVRIIKKYLNISQRRTLKLCFAEFKSTINSVHSEYFHKPKIKIKFYSPKKTNRTDLNMIRLTIGPDLRQDRTKSPIQQSLSYEIIKHPQCTLCQKGWKFPQKKIRIQKRARINIRRSRNPVLNAI